jgi:alanine-glyoxylate transaminase/serine-glyoxylate transaminase/serine-pyruvate transaminase
MTDDTLTMIPGPTPVRPSILEALARPTTSHQAPSFVEGYRECLENQQRMVFTTSAQPFVVSGAGTLAMEMALVNLLGPGERLLIVSQGFFGDRWAQIAEAFGIPHRLLQAEWGRAVEPERVLEALDSEPFAAVAMTHVDTSTGTAAPVAQYCDRLRRRDELVLLDGVCATACVEERFDAWGLDVLLTGAQKALGTPPGVAILLASARAMDKRAALESVPAYYADLLRWKPIMDNPALYFSTPPVNEIVALLEATRIIVGEGLEQRFRRHAQVARAMRAGFASLGLEIFTSADCRADTLSVLIYPEGIEDAPFRAAMAARKVVIAGALGSLAGKACRVGHMGNIGVDEVVRTLSALGEALAESGHSADVGAALAAARAES